MPGRQLSTRIVPADFAVPAGTAAVAPISSILQLGEVNLDRVQIVIPDGVAGLAGIAFFYAGQQILPFTNAASWIIGNNEQPSFPVDFELGGRLIMKAYNADVFLHTFYVRLTVTDLDVDGFVPIPLSAIS